MSLHHIRIVSVDNLMFDNPTLKFRPHCRLRLVHRVARSCLRSRRKAAAGLFLLSHLCSWLPVGLSSCWMPLCCAQPLPGLSGGTHTGVLLSSATPRGHQPAFWTECCCELCAGPRCDAAWLSRSQLFPVCRSLGVFSHVVLSAFSYMFSLSLPVPFTPPTCNVASTTFQLFPLSI